MANRLKLTPRRQNRLVKLMAGGATLAEAARACRLSREAVYKHARTDSAFAARLAAARARGPAPVPVADWRAIAEQLERAHPERWGLPFPTKIDWGGIEDA